MIRYTDLYLKRFSCQNPYATIKRQLSILIQHQSYNPVIVFFVVVFINLCSFSNIIDIVSGSFSRCIKVKFRKTKAPVVQLRDLVTLFSYMHRSFVLLNQSFVSIK